MITSTHEHIIDLHDGREARISIHTGPGYDNVWADGVLFDVDAEVVASSEYMRYLGYGCDTEIVALVLDKLAPDISDEIWQILEEQIPECRCELDEEDAT